jgi:hypothetical protein
MRVRPLPQHAICTLQLGDVGVECRQRVQEVTNSLAPLALLSESLTQVSQRDKLALLLDRRNQPFLLLDEF